MVFCNLVSTLACLFERVVTILILIDGFLQSCKEYETRSFVKVTILILIDGFLQSSYDTIFLIFFISHNPYFNRWFSAISLLPLFTHSYLRHNPYFNRWFSAIAAKISQNFTFLCKKLVFSDNFCELYFTQHLYINYCTNYLNTFLLKIGIIKAIINIIKE